MFLELTQIIERIKDREKSLIEIKRSQDSDIKIIKEQLQEDYQNLVFLEAQAQSKDARKEIITMRNKVIQQENLLKKYLQVRYARLVQKSSPKAPVLKNALAAFLVGGTICSIGQIFLNVFMNYGLATKEAGTFTSMVMVFLGALLTGLGVYDEIGRFGGAGSMVPITGFANSIVSPALEYKREGYVTGIGTKVFTIAGPVLLYGSLMSVLIGLLFYLLNKG
jgi:stage V sporulation protein AC